MYIEAWTKGMNRKRLGHGDEQDMQASHEDHIDLNQDSDRTKSRWVHGYKVIGLAEDKQVMCRYRLGCIEATRLRFGGLNLKIMDEKGFLFPTSKLGAVSQRTCVAITNLTSRQNEVKKTMGPSDDEKNTRTFCSLGVYT